MKAIGQRTLECCYPFRQHLTCRGHADQKAAFAKGQLRPIVRRIGLGDAQQSYDFFTVFECRDQSKQPSTLNFPHSLDQLDQFTFAGKARGDR